MSAADGAARRIESLLAEPDAQLAARYPGDPGTRQPVHSVYVPAPLLDASTPAEWGARARESLGTAGVARLLEVHDLLPPGRDRDRVVALVETKLATEPIEDLRIDLEDGFGDVDDATEDAAVDRAVAAIGQMRAAGTLPPFVGIRFKSFEAPTRARGIATLTRFVTGLHRSTGLPPGLVLTLPKVTSVAQVEALVLLLEALESDLALAPGTLTFEIQVETPQAVLGPDGVSPLPAMIAAGGGRVTGLPYGTYDYSAALGVTATDQSMDHPVADHAKAVMQVAAAGTGARVSDGSTNLLPVGSRAAVEAAWAEHGRLVSRSLHQGIYQGWDLHPAQLPSRFAATYAFFRTGLGALVERLERYLSHEPGAELDEPATAAAMASFVLRGLHCGAVAADEIPFSVHDLRAMRPSRPTSRTGDR